MGKRTCARAAAEACRKPIYTVAASQLGPSAAEREAGAAAALALCRRWGAILLIEHIETLADGLGGRGPSGADFALLRLIEDHCGNAAAGGVVFLTASHLDASSPLLGSSSMVVLPFPALSGPSLEEVWARAIAAAVAAASMHETIRLGEDGCLDLATLSAYPLNCRQVHQALRIAVAMARREHAVSMLPSDGTTAPSPAAAVPGGAARGEAREWSLRQAHIEKALWTIAPFASTRAHESELAGGGG